MSERNRVVEDWLKENASLHARIAALEAERDEARRLAGKRHSRICELLEDLLAVRKERDEARAALRRSQVEHHYDEHMADKLAYTAATARAQAFAECEKIALEAATAHDLDGEIWVARRIADWIHAVSARPDADP